MRWAYFGKLRTRCRYRSAQMLLGVGLTRNQVTVLGATVVSFGSILWLSQGALIPGAFVIAFVLWVDRIDGTMARVGDAATNFGAFLDSVLDRLVDGVIYSSLAWWLISVGRW